MQLEQDNRSCSTKNVLRGLQQPQRKVVLVMQSEVFDVAADLYKSSKTFGEWVRVFLSASNRGQLRIPEEFPHGFVAVSDTIECLYETTHYCAPTHENCIAWNDATLSVPSPNGNQRVLSAKDVQGKTFTETEVFD